MPSIPERSRIGDASRRCLLVAAAIVVGMGCRASQITQIGTPERASHTVRALVFVPGSSLLAYSIGVEMTKRGYSVVDTREATALLAKHNVNPADLLTPLGLATLGKGGVDAVVSVSSTGSPMGGSAMRNVAVRVTSTRTSGMIGGLSWRNGSGGMPGSTADLIMQKGLTEAANEIAEALANQLAPAGR